METENKKRNLYEKIQAVSNEVRNIEKNMIVGRGSNAYKAVQDIDVVLAVKDAETKYRVVSIPVRQELVSSEVIRESRDDGRETIKYSDVVKMTVRIVDLDNPSEIVEVEAFGRGLDSADKGFGKASTYARKYALLNAYKIATGADPDEEKSKETQVKKEMSDITVAVTNYLFNDTEYYSNIKSYFKVDDVSKLSQSQITTIYNSLKNKGRL